VQLAIQGASDDLKVLIVSTDPAHSLGDALDVDLRSSEGKPVALTDPLTGGRLFAAEVNAEAALREFRTTLEGFDVARLADSLGVSAELLESLGLREFSGLLNNPPPGIDELVALGNVMDDRTDDYDVVIVDTAPTGHSLRLLALPQFMDGLLGKLLKLRAKLAGLTNTLKMFMGDQAAKERTQTLDNAMDKVEAFRQKIARLETTLKDKSLTSFMIVTVPTKLAVEESKRLLTELTSEGIAVNHIVINQCVEGDEGGESGTTSEALANYYSRRVAGQQKWISKLKQATEEISASEDYQSNGDDGAPICVSELPFFDVELVGVPALGYVGMQHLANNPSFDSLMNDQGRGTRGEPRVVICGGKGGVGKSESTRY
jgi:arsenite-transporting ATPase